MPGQVGLAVGGSWWQAGVCFGSGMMCWLQHSGPAVHPSSVVHGTVHALLQCHNVGQDGVAGPHTVSASTLAAHRSATDRSNDDACGAVRPYARPHPLGAVARAVGSGAVGGQDGGAHCGHRGRHPGRRHDAGEAHACAPCWTGAVLWASWPAHAHTAACLDKQGVPICIYMYIYVGCGYPAWQHAHLQRHSGGQDGVAGPLIGPLHLGRHPVRYRRLR